MTPTKDTPKETWVERFDSMWNQGYRQMSLGCSGCGKLVKAFISKELELAKAEGAREMIDKVIKILPSVTRKDVPWKEERNSFRRYLLRRLATLKGKEVTL